ncbi:MAG TPA: hypothetical protein VFF42_00075, partial [Candidatus Eremiobacteraceae bacterium]|nr:hypothetical protein [Candidatus Eremiobacteraceae bacterium]
MADWKQITARIRRARTSKDPVAQLSNLFEKTHDAMAAFELARYFETTGHASDAGKWYATAAGRFRRADWKTKAQEAALRLGASLPPESPLQRGDDFHLSPPPVAEVENSEPPAPEVEISDDSDTIPVAEKQSADAADSPAAPRSDKRPRRRGRRGGRNRRKSGASATAAAPDRPAAAKTSAAPSAQRTPPRAMVDEDQPALAPAVLTRSVSTVASEAGADVAVPGLRGRYGDPGLSSRLTQLEMQFRRLLTCAPSRLNDADQAPVGPGVFVLTDSDLTTYYYVEACQTLRIA